MQRVGLRAALAATVLAGTAAGIAAAAPTAKQPPNLSSQDKALFQYAACMRKKGVNIPDPVKGKDGKYSFPKIPTKVLSAPGVRQKARACAAQLPRTRPAGAQGSVFGPIVSVQGQTFTVKSSQSPTGRSTVSTGSATITRDIQARRTTLKVGACVMATGARNSKGVVAASRITISTPAKGQCGGGFFASGGGAPPGNVPAPGGQGGTRQRPPGGFGGNANFGFAFGSVTKLSGATLTVKGSFGQTTRTTTVTVSSKTSLLRTIRVKASAIKVNLCAFVRGASSDKGVTVKATNISLARQSNGTCTMR